MAIERTRRTVALPKTSETDIAALRARPEIASDVQAITEALRFTAACVKLFGKMSPEELASAKRLLDYVRTVRDSGGEVVIRKTSPATGTKVEETIQVFA